MGIAKAIIRLAAPVPHPEKFDRCLFIGPHPDDIEIGAGATAARLAAEGKTICFLICTDGRYGSENLPAGTLPDAVAAIRRQETLDSAAFLGVRDVRFLELSDGGFYDSKELLVKMAAVIGDFRPDVIFAPDPRVTSECHVDHRNVGEAAMQLACFAPYHGIMEQYGSSAAPVQAIALYMTAKPNRYVRTNGYFSKQIEAVRRFHLSQFPAKTKDADAFGPIALYLKIRSVDFGLRNHCRSAEGFRVLGVTQMHCLPEAGN